MSRTPEREKPNSRKNRFIAFKVTTVKRAERTNDQRCGALMSLRGPPQIRAQVQVTIFNQKRDNGCNPLRHLCTLNESKKNSKAVYC